MSLTCNTEIMTIYRNDPIFHSWWSNTISIAICLFPHDIVPIPKYTNSNCTRNRMSIERASTRRRRCHRGYCRSSSPSVSVLHLCGRLVDCRPSHNIWLLKLTFYCLSCLAIVLCCFRRGCCGGGASSRKPICEGCLHRRKPLHITTG